MDVMREIISKSTVPIWTAKDFAEIVLKVPAAKDAKPRTIEVQFARDLVKGGLIVRTDYKVWPKSAKTWNVVYMRKGALQGQKLLEAVKSTYGNQYRYSMSTTKKQALKRPVKPPVQAMPPGDEMADWQMGRAIIRYVRHLQQTVRTKDDELRNVIKNAQESEKDNEKTIGGLNKRIADLNRQVEDLKRLTDKTSPEANDGAGTFKLGDVAKFK